MVIPLKREATNSMICSDIPVGLVYKRFMPRYWFRQGRYMDVAS